MTYFKNNVALRYGVKSAIIAQYLWDCLYIVKKSECHIAKFRGKEWCRCSVAHLTSIFPYLSKHQIRDAIEVLVENKVLKKKPFNASCFDHTNWYAFTEYGKSLMTQGGV